MYPLADVPFGYATTGEVVVNMITPFGPCVVRLSDLDSFLAEAAPEMGITMTAFSTCVNLVFQLTLVRNFVLFREMVSEALAAVANLATNFTIVRLGAIAYPCLELIVLDALMSLPVVFTPECLGTVGEGTSVWF
jgi:hypothetical protein